MPNISPAPTTTVGVRTAGGRLWLACCVLALVAASCGGETTTDTEAEGSETETVETVDELAYSDEGRDTDPDFDPDANPAETVTTITGTTEQSAAQSSTTTPETSTSSSPPTTEGSGLGPVTTVAVSSGGDPDGIYRGVLGNLDPDEIVVAGAVAPPASESGVMPLTGLAGSVPNHPAAAVKIDNGSAAVPQTGLNSADIVIEEEVEGGVTRFAAIFHSTPTIVGPVRSGRTTDLALISSLGEPLMIYSGANQITEGILRSQPAIQNRSHGSSSGYWRDSSRRAPSNLYTDTAPHWASAAGGPPPPQFHYRDMDDTSASGSAALPGASDDEFTVAYGSSTARWKWDGTQWLRWQRGSEHMVAAGQQVSATNVVVIEAERVDTGMVDGSGGAVPEFVFVGTGRATVFTEGKRIEGTWTRPTLNSVATLTHSPGIAIELTPGRTWIQLIDAGGGALG